MDVRDRIKELRRVPASELLPHPHNWRAHPTRQRDALMGILSEIGFADAVLVRETAEGYQIIDGHLRTEIMGDAEVPVLVLDVTGEEADKMLLTLDPLASMATADTNQLQALLEGISFEMEAINAVLTTLREDDLDALPDFTDYPTLPEGDKSEIGQMTFMVTEDQRETIVAALSHAKAVSRFVATSNENSNGNALALICEQYVNS